MIFVKPLSPDGNSSILNLRSEATNRWDDNL